MIFLMVFYFQWPMLICTPFYVRTYNFANKSLFFCKYGNLAGTPRPILHPTYPPIR